MKEVGKTWSIGDLPLAVTADSEDYTKARIGQLGVLDTPYTTKHNMGTESQHRNLTAHILSGYETTLLPMIEIGGYNTLTSDQGNEGDYHIVTCNPVHKQALNKPFQVYEVKMELRKESQVSPLPDYPDVCIYPTRLGGVWYSIDFTGPEVPDQAIWTQIGTSGDWPGNDWTLDFACNTGDPFSNMYILANSSRDVIKWNGTTWSYILEQTNYQNSGHGDYSGSASARCESIWVDQANDNLWALVAGGSAGQGVITAYKSTDSGSSWSIYNIYSGVTAHPSSVMAYNDYVAVGERTWFTGRYSIDGGTSWRVSDSIGTAHGSGRKFIVEDLTHYYRRGFDGNNRLYVDYFSGDPSTATAPADGDRWDGGHHPHQLWASPTDVSKARHIVNNHLWTTTDAFTNATDRGAFSILGGAVIEGMAYRVAEEYDEDSYC